MKRWIASRLKREMLLASTDGRSLTASLLAADARAARSKLLTGRAAEPEREEAA